MCQAGTLGEKNVLTKIQDGRQRTCENHIFAHNFAPMSHRDLILMAKHMFCGSIKTIEYKLMVDYTVFMTKCGFNNNSCKKMSEIYMSIAIRESLILHHHYLFFGFHKHINTSLSSLSSL